MDSNTLIGKDVIDSLTWSMYEDPLCIYREYIQNSADQIDIAADLGILASVAEGHIEITIDTKTNSVTIEDNATGIESEKVASVLKNIATSSKKRDKNKGFRGIGRLGGIAYCDKLIFETSYKGEAIQSTLTWDAKSLKEIINDRTKNEQAKDVIDTVTTFHTSSEKAEKHYFKVTLKGVDNSALLNKESVVQYLSMVAPVPFNKGFIFKNLIKNKLVSLGADVEEYNIFVNNDRIEKAYTTSIYSGDEGNKIRVDEITDIQYLQVQSDKFGDLAVGWYGISNFEKQIPTINTARGIRLRKGNIQIGSSDTLIKFFKEQRGNFYFFGELYAINNLLIPNARRDYFIENAVLFEFERCFKSLIWDQLHQLYYYASEVRSCVKRVEQLNEFKIKLQEKKVNGFTNDQEREKYQKEFQIRKETAEKALKTLEKLKDKIDDTESSPKSRIFNNITKTNKKTLSDVANVEEEFKEAKTTYATDSLSKLSRKERKLVSDIFAVIDNVLTPDLANNLKEKVKEVFK